MKKFNKYFIICAGLVLAACGGDKKDPTVDPVVPEPDPETRILTFTLPETGFKTAWEAGDEIVVHGEYAAREVTVKLAAGDISGDGKTAVKEVSGLYPYVNEECTSTLYASWPASATGNIKHCFWYTAFSDTNTPLLAACEVENNFVFHNICSAVTFSVTGDFDSYVFTGRKDTPVGYELYQVMVTDKVTNLNQFRRGPLVNISGDLVGEAGSVQTAYIPGDIDLPKGFVLKFGKDGQLTKAVTDKHAFAVDQCGTLELGDVTDRLEDFGVEIDTDSAVSLATGGNANCYMVNAAGVYSFPTLKGNSSTSIGSVETVKVLWETWCNTSEVTPKSIIKAVMYENSKIFFEVPEGYHPGNALIAALDEDDNLLWSWHIWAPETPVTDVAGTQYSDLPTMSRNLGALVDTPASAIAPPESFGLLYQWGRKDPFPGLGSNTENVSATTAGEVSYVNEQTTLDGGIQNPTTFYYVSEKDWQNNQDIVSGLWAETSKTLYDPCPPGYEVPERKSGLAFWGGSTIVGQDFFTLNSDLCSFKVGDHVFPLSGRISSDSGLHEGVGERVQLWCGRWDSGTQNGYGFSGTTGETPEFRRKGTIRSTGGSIRCVKR